jgi:multiple sugar transport system substrate-binding protein
MRTKFWIFINVLVILSMVLLGGCSSTSANTPAASSGEAAQSADAATSAENSDVVTITIFVGFGTGTEPAQIELHNQMAAEFNESHPGIKVEFLHVNYDDHDSKFSTMLAGDMAPDIVMPTGVLGIGKYLDEWMDLTPYIERDNYDMSDFYGPALAMHTYPDKVIGMPIGLYPSVTYYNEDLFDKAGVAYPPHEFGNPDWTYDSLIDVSQQLTFDANGNAANSADFDIENISQWGWAGWEWSPFRMVPSKFGDSPLGVSADMKTATMNNAAWVESMQYVHDSIWKYGFRPSGEVVESSFSDVDPLQSNQVAMWEVYSWMAYAYESWTENFNWNVAAIPSNSDGSIVAEANGDTFAIPQSSHHPDEAWEVAKWFMEPENLSRLAASYGCIPARKSLAGSWLESMSAQYPNVDFQVFLDSIEYMDANPNNESWVPNFQRIYDAQENAASQIYSGASHDVQAVMDDLNTEAQTYLDEYWAEH